MKRSPCRPDISSPRGTKRSPCRPDISSSRAQAKRSPCRHAGRFHKGCFAMPHRFALQTILHVLMVITAKRFAMTNRSSPRGTKRFPCWQTGRFHKGCFAVPHRFALQTVFHVLMVITAKRFAMTNQASPRGTKRYPFLRHRERKRSDLPAGMQADSTRDASLCHTVLPDEQHFLRSRR